ncbi:hypothetical protein MOO46_05540 [Apilactobacillus apisilvae]|uniref:Uncharacterized protein n=1 Tax=Apilactobacillus apisilvae TaxID=2923364 RepID=A0ABY4PGV5_9LACO|nr:hypothetical protein [Apilactobacillus apisilvae]UQS84711.1 hypothetical protein MOO46_05540 [Apilactobacillus apisilvae]
MKNDYYKGLQKAFRENNSYEYMKNHKIMSYFYKLGINNNRRLRSLFNIHHSDEYIKGYTKISIF